MLAARRLLDLDPKKLAEVIGTTPVDALESVQRAGRYLRRARRRLQESLPTTEPCLVMEAMPLRFVELKLNPRSRAGATSVLGGGQEGVVTRLHAPSVEPMLDGARGVAFGRDYGTELHENGYLGAWVELKERRGEWVIVPNLARDHFSDYFALVRAFWRKAGIDEAPYLFTARVKADASQLLQLWVRDEAQGAVLRPPPTDHAIVLREMIRRPSEEVSQAFADAWHSDLYRAFGEFPPQH